MKPPLPTAAEKRLVRKIMTYLGQSWFEGVQDVIAGILATSRKRRPHVSKKGKHMDENRNEFPIQARARSHPRKRASINRAVYMAAYEVYCQVFAPQPALVEGNCRGGFGTGELIAFLYARSFPKSEWRMRVDEGLNGLDLE